MHREGFSLRSPALPIINQNRIRLSTVLQHGDKNNHNKSLFLQLEFPGMVICGTDAAGFLLWSYRGALFFGPTEWP